MSTEHFDGKLKDDDRSPTGFEIIVGVSAVLIDRNTGRIVFTGQPNERHNCDMRGCGSIEHKIAEFEIDKDVLPPRPVIEEPDQ